MKSAYQQFQVRPVQISNTIMREVSEALRIIGNCNNSYPDDGYGRFVDEVYLLTALQELAMRDKRFAREEWERGDVMGLS